MVKFILAIMLSGLSFHAAAVVELCSQDIKGHVDCNKYTTQDVFQAAPAESSVIDNAIAKKHLEYRVVQLENGTYIIQLKIVMNKNDPFNLWADIDSIHLTTREKADQLIQDMRKLEQIK